ncbi:hypothetical protein EK21DRAFT_84637 [Setomelanomma holmii]|uniref:DUF7730 domain-containing protein n=1 Tax=Setomelanomma holmii TaxID=210430 RepID=A0A9P4HL95_9PLEO|nr:hypothetical protein EK21DRAFT_84637 [Setomelanomma holmii]
MPATSPSTNAHSRKPHLSPEQLGPSLKRAWSESHPNKTLQFVSKQQIQSPLLRLPWELRNQIYHNAFGGDPIRLHHRGLEYVVMNSRNMFSDVDYTTEKPPWAKGLPIWLRSCKQIFDEALDTFGRGWTFTTDLAYLVKHEQRDEEPKNPLSFNRNIVRNIGHLEDMDYHDERGPVKETVEDAAESASGTELPFLTALKKMEAN